MKTLELRDIAGYLPYGLFAKYYIDQEKTKPVRDSISLIKGYSLENDCFDVEVIYEWGTKGKTKQPFNHCMPILRPMSDLTKPIIHKGYNEGKEFVPIVELAKTITEHKNWMMVEDYHITCCECKIESAGVTMRFGYLDNVFLHNGLDIDNPFRGTINYPINYISLFDLLNSWMFDYRGLIDSGLALDYNQIKEKCYE